MHPKGVKASLYNAYARVRRAKQHLVDLNKQIDAFWRTAGNLSVHVPPSATGIFENVTDTAGYFSPDPANLSPMEMIPILVGETVYNLRSALDYLVYELAILDSGRVQENTQFPIEDLPKGSKGISKHETQWRTGQHPKLSGVSIGHHAILYKFQPASGCHWTGVLRNLSNPDKHRTLTVHKSEFRVTVNVGVPHAETISPITGDPMKVKGQITRQISFNDGISVVKTLEVLQSEVAAVLDLFSAEF